MALTTCVVGGLAQGASKVAESFKSSRMGTIDGYMTTVTPKVQSYQDNAGASGELVFALNVNRKG